MENNLVEFKWENLKDDQCPKCSYALIERKKGFECTRRKELCGFFIRTERKADLLERLFDGKARFLALNS